MATQFVSKLLLETYGSLLRLVRPNIGLTKLSFNPLVNFFAARVPAAQIARLPSGIRLAVNTTDYDGRVLWLNGSNDWKVTRAVTSLLHPGDIFLDIGANHGSIGFEASRRVGPSGEVHLFEPQSRLCSRLRDALGAANLTNVVLHQIALSDADGEVVLAGPADHTGMATIVSPDELDRDRGFSETVAMHETAGYLRPIVGKRSFGVKIDVEGAEPRIIPALFKLPGLRFVVFECATNQDWLRTFFTASGFRTFGLKRSVRPRAVALTAASDWSRFHDFVAICSAAEPSAGELGFDRLRGLLS